MSYMTYNIHPIFVHFPIALLFLYSLIKIFPVKKLFPKVSWKHIEILLLSVGMAGAALALATGDTAEHLLSPSNRQLVQTHSMFGEISTWLYGALLLGEILFFINPFIIEKFKLPKVNSFLLFIQRILTSPFVSKTLALLGFVAISITGLLGGVLVYGVTADPLASIVLRVLGISY